MNKKNTDYRDLSVVALSLLTLGALPFMLSESFHDSQRLVSTLLFSILLVFKLRTAQVSIKALLVSGIIWLAGLLLVSHSKVTLWSLAEFALLSSVLILALIGWQKVVSLETLQYLTFIFAGIQALYLVRNLLNYAFSMIFGGNSEVFSLIDGFSNIRFYGQFLIWTTPFILGVLATQSTIRFRKIVLLIVMLSASFEFLTGTRAFWFALFITIPVIAWLTFEHATSYLKELIKVAVGGFLFYVLMILVIPYLFNIDIGWLLARSVDRELTSSSGRVDLWIATIHAVQTAPWFGIGPMLMSAPEWSPYSAHPHNYILQFAAEWGVPLTLLLVSGGLWLANRWRILAQSGDQERLFLALPIVASLAAGFSAGLVDGLMVMPVSLTYMALILSLAVALWRMWTPEVPRRQIPLALAILWLIPVLWLSIFVVVAGPARLGKEAVIATYGLYETSFPRFWETGKINVEKAKTLSPLSIFQPVTAVSEAKAN